MTETAMEKILPTVKKFARIDFEDDDDLVKIIVEAVTQAMAEVIPEFDAGNMTSRQKVIMFAGVKDLYDNRDKYGKDVKKMQAACASMLLSEVYEPKRKEVAAGE